MTSPFQSARRPQLAGAIASLVAILPGPARCDEAGAVTVGGCRLETVGSAVVSAVEDDRTLALADGRLVRLGGIEIGAPAEVAAKGNGLLQSLVGAPVTLRRAGPQTDRHGRVLAQVFATKDGSERWIQSDLVARGHARVGARLGDRPCAAELWARERGAREAKLGLWGDPYYVIRRAENPAAIAAEDGRFAIVEGQVLSVRESGGTIYVNFGRRWTEDFAVIIAKRNERSFVGAGVEPKKLEGRRVRVRGWVEVRSGPAVEAIRPEQIEILEAR